MRQAQSSCRPAESRGFSLIEVMIALAISMVIAAAMASLFSQSVSSRQKVDSQGQRIESGRYSLDLLADDLRHAGFYGDYLPRSSTGTFWPVTDSANATWTTPQPCAATVATLGWANSGTINVPVHIMGYEGGHSSPATLPTALTDCLSNYKTGTDVVVIRRVSTLSYAPSAAGAEVGDVFLQASNCSTENTTTPFILAAKAGAGANFTAHKVNCSTVTNINRYVVRIYYVASCNVCSPSDGIPTLKVAELLYSGGTLQMVSRSVTPGVENMHLEFGVDISGDGVPDGGFAVSNANPIATSPGFNWQNVMMVKAYLLVRDLTSTSGHTDNRSYVLGNATISAPNDDYKRTVFSTTIRLMNPSGAREPS